MIRRWIEEMASVLAENRACLSELDSPIGDADHGNNMERGFRAVLATLPETEDIGALLKGVAMTLISRVGGAAGPLYGTFFLEAGKPLAGKTELTPEDVVQLFENGVTGIRKRGRSDTGMKTMLDALVPAADALRSTLAEGGDLAAALKAATDAAEAGMKGTIPMLAQRGRASYLGERSVGHQDPGATSSYLIVRALGDAVEGISR
ncbi:dihydroxyacetone kinase subunit L [Kushneria phosphatilytica]|uniref:Dihydroxyacetone kinase subunit L n=2 Tax=Kushneria phosphatilytica TaxID=657387 RepID=A0A1S1NYE6_9GAMM|nr:dihydroxyacetone kinase subunit L [Kushneria phosphatilytica]QEL12842.1 dihydroxyacetone kinase subunit L [Kushneria phosphatilytica]